MKKCDILYNPVPAFTRTMTSVKLPGDGCRNSRDVMHGAEDRHIVKRRCFPRISANDTRSFLPTARYDHTFDAETRHDDALSH